MEGLCSTGQSPQWAVVPMEEERGGGGGGGGGEEEEEEEEEGGVGGRRWRELVADRKKWKDIVRQAKAQSGM